MVPLNQPLLMSLEMTNLSWYLMIFETKSYDVFDSKHSVMGLVTHSDHIVFVT